MSDDEVARIYLAGPIAGRPDSECVDWRERAAELLYPTCVLDPLKARDCRGREQEPGMAEIVVENDIADIRSAAALLVMFDKPSIGTSMEIRLAKAELKKLIFVVDVSNAPRSPWLSYHCDHFFDNLEAACEAIRAHLSGR